MSDEPNSKRRKMDRKKPYHNPNKPKNFLEPGIRGFMATCNYNEKECVRECYNLLNEYADQMDSKAAIECEQEKAKDVMNDSGTVAEKSDDEEEEEDISTALENQIKSMKTVNRSRFQQVSTNIGNCIFIKSTIPNPNELGVHIVRNIAETKKRKTRSLLRLWPVDAVCRANVEDIKNAAGKLFDKVFLNAEPTTFSIAFNKRHNNVIDRMTVIQELAELVTFKSAAHKVDLKEPKIAIVVEVIKGLCCISLLPDYFQLKKYNIHELSQDEKEKPVDEEKPKSQNDGSGEATVDAQTEAKEPEAADQQTWNRISITFWIDFNHLRYFNLLIHFKIISWTFKIRFCYISSYFH